MKPLVTTSNLHLSRLWNDESGAVTVDWVVLTAAVVGLVLSVFTIFTPEVFGAAITKISAAMAQP